jgi:hypothetical protein
MKVTIAESELHPGFVKLEETNPPRFRCRQHATCLLRLICLHHPLNGQCVRSAVRRVGNEGFVHKLERRRLIIQLPAVVREWKEELLPGCKLIARTQ